MKFKALFASLFVFGLVGVAHADEDAFRAALISAYQNNPDIQASRAQLRALDESVPQAISGFRPTLNAVGTATSQSIKPPSVGMSSNQKSMGLQLIQPLFNGGQTIAATRKAQHDVYAGQDTLKDSEQQILLLAAQTYFDMIQNQATLALTLRNEEVLAKQLDETRSFYDVGEVTKTDVAQAESRLAQAHAEMIQARGNLQIAQANFEKIVGYPPVNLTDPEFSFELPANQDDTILLAEKANPLVMAAENKLESAKADIDQNTGALLPQLSLQGGVTRNFYSNVAVPSPQNVNSIGLNLTVPLYEAGAVTSKIRAAKQTAQQRKNERASQLHRVRQNASDSWQAFVTSKANIQAFETQIEAASLTLEGVRQEFRVGAKTVLDVLNAQQELLVAQVNLVQEQRNYNLSQFQLLAAIGSLNPMTLNLPIDPYDAKVHYNQVKYQPWGLSISE